jgi:hypothetical protein
MLFFMMVLATAGAVVGLVWLAGFGQRLAQTPLPEPPSVPEPPAPPPLAPERLALLDSLVAAGYLAHLAPEEAAARQAELRRTNWLWAVEVGRVFAHDESELGEVGPRALFEAARPLLEREGVTIGVIQQKAVVGLQVELTINGRLQVLLEPGETDTLEEAAALVTRRTFRLLNRLLEQAGSEVRAYRLRDVFDATVIFLTPAQWRLVVDSPAVPEDERPEVA